MQQIQISAKDLGQIVLDDFCPRCFWIKLHVKPLPWQIFPGIFSSIDAYTKKVAHRWIEMGEGFRPTFMDELGVTGWLKTPSWRYFNTEISKYGIKLTGAADDFWTIKNDNLHIPDFKTAKYTVNQDKLIPMYKIQLNGYAKITSDNGTYPPVESLSMIYMEPQTDEHAARDGAQIDFFDMQFNPKYVPVKLDLESLDPLFEKTRQIYDGPPPEGRKGCKDCEALDHIAELTHLTELGRI